jgi:hypothetical protein
MTILDIWVGLACFMAGVLVALALLKIGRDA